MALVDADPYGLDILSVYNYGSKALKHENERLAAGGKVVWIGVLATEFSRCAHAHGLDETCEMFSRLGIDKDKLLPISRQDEKKVIPFDVFCVVFGDR